MQTLSPAPRVVLRVFVFDDGHRWRGNDVQRQVSFAATAVRLAGFALDDESEFGASVVVAVVVVVVVVVIVFVTVPATFRTAAVGHLLLLFPLFFSEPPDRQADQKKARRGRQ